MKAITIWALTCLFPMRYRERNKRDGAGEIFFASDVAEARHVVIVALRGKKDTRKHDACFRPMF